MKALAFQREVGLNYGGIYAKLPCLESLDSSSCNTTISNQKDKKVHFFLNKAPFPWRIILFKINNK